MALGKNSLNKLRRRRKVAVYIRVSTDEQALHGYSLEAQKESLIEYAKTNDLEIVDFYIDEGKTARKELRKRTEVLRMLDDIEHSDKGIEMIIFIKIDRWFRNVADYHYVQRILERHNVTWKATQEDYNTETADGRMKVNIMLSVAENEADRTSERIKFVNESKIKKGQVIYGDNALPLWLKVGIVDGVKRIVLDPENSEIMREYIAHFKTHNSKRMAMLHCNQKFNKKYHYNRYNNIFKNTLAYGKYRDNDHYCEPLLTYEEFMELVQLGDRHLKTNPVKRIYKFAGLVICHKCGRRMIGSNINKPNGEYKYYRCIGAKMQKDCPNQGLVNEKKLEQYLLDNVNRMIQDYLVKFEMETTKTVNETKIKKDIQHVEEEISRINYMFQKRRLTIEQYDAECEALDDKLTKLKKSLTTKHHDTTHLLDFVNSDWQTVYHTLNEENKRALWRSVIKSIVKTGENSYDIEFY